MQLSIGIRQHFIPDRILDLFVSHSGIKCLIIQVVVPLIQCLYLCLAVLAHNVLGNSFRQFRILVCFVVVDLMFDLRNNILHEAVCLHIDRTILDHSCNASLYTSLVVNIQASDHRHKP